MNDLVPCPSCNRHVRKLEASCPFCSAELSLTHLAPPTLPRARLSRAATFAFGASLAVAACGGDTEEGKRGGGGSGGMSSSGSSSGGSAGTSIAGDLNTGGSAVALYGGPPAGSGGNDNTAGGTVPPYGTPPAAGGGPVPIYGAAPTPNDE
jgi:hypothetical protein